MHVCVYVHTYVQVFYAPRSATHVTPHIYFGFLDLLAYLSFRVTRSVLPHNLAHARTFFRHRSPKIQRFGTLQEYPPPTQ